MAKYIIKIKVKKKWGIWWAPKCHKGNTVAVWVSDC